VVRNDPGKTISPLIARPAVDVGTGEVTDAMTDFRRAGLLPLTMGRRYSSFDARTKLYVPAWRGDESTPFGPGWRADWDFALRQTVNGFVYTRPNGEEIDVRNRVDGRVVHVGHRIELEGVDARRVCVIDYARGRSPVTHVFATAGADNQWHLQSIEYRHLNRIDLIRDDHGRVTRLEHTRSRNALVLSYANGRISFVELMTPGGGRHFVAGYRYDERGLLVEVQDRAGCAVTYAYHSNQALARTERRGGAVFCIDYDRSGRCTRVAGADGYHLRELRHDRAARRTVVCNAYGEQWTYNLDRAGRVIATTSPLGRATSFEFDVAGRVTRAADAAKRITSYEYDELGRLIGRHGPADSRLWVYDEQHRIITRGDGREDILASYDENHDLVSVERDEAMWELTYNLHGERTSLRTPLGSTQTYLYDELGNVVGETDFKGNFVHYEYDSFGRCTKIIDPLGGAEERSTDELDRVVTSTQGGGTTSRFEYTGDARITMGPSGTREALRHDPYGRVLEHVDSEGLTGRFDWGKEPAQLLSIVNATGDREHVYYDADDRIVEVRTVDARTVRVHYSDLGAASIDMLTGRSPGSECAAARTTIERDDSGRVIRVASGAEERRFEYDEGGLLTRAKTEGVLVEFTHDARGRCVREAVVALAGATPGMSDLRREFDVLGRKVRIACTGAPEIAIGWDENTRVCSVQIDETAVRYARDANGAEVERISQGLRLSTKRDLEGRETEWTYELAGREPTRIQGSYDSRGFRSFLSVVAANVNESVVVRYDGRGRLRAVVRQAGLPSAFFEYDGEGHWLLHARTTSGNELLRILDAAHWDRMAVVASYHADGSAAATVRAGGRLDTLRMGSATVRYRWDDRGRVTEKTVLSSDREDTWRFEYDAWDALRRVESTRGVVFEYRYDAFGRCIERTTTEGASIRFIWDGQRLLHVFTDGLLTETRVSDDESDELLVQRFGDGRVDIRSDSFRALEELLGSDGSVAPPSSRPSAGHSFCDEESLIVIGIGYYFDIETGYHLTWQRGEFVVPLPLPMSPPDPIEAIVAEGVMRPADGDPPVLNAFMGRTLDRIAMNGF